MLRFWRIVGAWLLGFKGPLKCLLSTLVGQASLTLTLHPKLQCLTSLPGPLAFLHWAELAPRNCLTDEPCVTETSSPVWFPLAEREMTLSPSCVSLHDPVELRCRHHPRDSDTFRTQEHSAKRRRCQKCRCHSLVPLFYLQHTPCCTVDHFYLLSLTAFVVVAVVVVLSKLWRCSCSLWSLLVLRSLGFTDHRLSPTCCLCLLSL